MFVLKKVMQPQNNLDKISHVTSISIYELLADT